MGSIRLRRKMIAEDGPGWAVTDYDGNPLPGRWATKSDAWENGLVGVYLLSGADVIEIKAETVTETFTIEDRQITVEAQPSLVPGKYQIHTVAASGWRNLIGYVEQRESRPAAQQWAMFGPEGPNGPEYGGGRASVVDAVEALVRRDVSERRKG